MRGGRLMKKKRLTESSTSYYIPISILFGILVLFATCTKKDNPNRKHEEVTLYTDTFPKEKNALNSLPMLTDKKIKKEDPIGDENNLDQTIAIDNSTLEYLKLKAWANACMNVKSGGIGIDFKLEHDIDLTGLEWIPIGDWEIPYIGTFDGQGHKITGLNIDIESDAGFFRAIGQGGIVRNLHLEGKISGKGIVGGITAFNTGGIIQGCSFSNGTILNNTHFVIGGICGFNSKNGKIYGCILQNTSLEKEYIYASVIAGGIVGANDQATVAACLINYAKLGNLSAKHKNNIGGVAYSNDGNIIACIVINTKWRADAAGICFLNKERGLIRHSLWMENSLVHHGIFDDLNEVPQGINYSFFAQNADISINIAEMNQILHRNGIAWNWTYKKSEKESLMPTVHIPVIPGH